MFQKYEFEKSQFYATYIENIYLNRVLLLSIFSAPAGEEYSAYLISRFQIKSIFFLLQENRLKSRRSEKHRGLVIPELTHRARGEISKGKQLFGASGQDN